MGRTCRALKAKRRCFVFSTRSRGLAPDKQYQWLRLGGGGGGTLMKGLEGLNKKAFDDLPALDDALRFLTYILFD